MWFVQEDVRLRFGFMIEKVLAKIWQIFDRKIYTEKITSKLERNCIETKLLPKISSKLENNKDFSTENRATLVEQK